MTPESLEKSRLEFEEMMSIRYPFHDLSRLSNGVYIDPYTFHLYVGWKIRQESLVVELPRKINKPDCDYSDGYDCAIMQVTHRIKSAGINYTERE